ncbi:MAG TPA: P1 family peptidase [Anaerolineales bacterium]|nr:P1 family peptidase [Anaerolineales bacterium]
MTPGIKLKNAITDVRGIEVGHAQDDEALTGCTVILCRKGAVAGVDVRGGAPGTRETDLLDPVNLVEKVHAVVLAGGSAFGLDSASGVMQYLEEKKIGYSVGAAKIPIVPAAILYDLGLGRADVRPDAAMGYRAAASASSKKPAEGNVGAGTGASVGKLRGMKYAMKAGIGTASMNVNGIIIGALVAVNAIGDVVDPDSGTKIAGLRSDTTLEWMISNETRRAVKSNTVIGVIATDAALTKAQATKVAQMAQDGLARSIRPAHTQFDGDTIFALATGQKDADVSMVGAFAAEVMAQAIVRAVKIAESAGGLPGLKNA